MTEERRNSTRHRLVVDKRESVHISGVLDVISFDEAQVICETDMGVLILSGFNLHVKSLNLESGVLEIFGGIEGINYENDVPAVGHHKKKSTMLKKIFK
ncbi:MAG: sporulation protein YabP [Defluviitaleaceae bacterium]|nr:sporulation protein YabP [Defluviitaleaceae bacterium]